MDVPFAYIESLAYIGGFFDGEGNISIRPVGKKLMKYSRIEVSCANNDIRPLKFIDNHFNFGSVSKNRHGIYRYRITHRGNIKFFLEAIIPFLIVKQSQALTALKWIIQNSKQILKVKVRTK
jgi:hypothetical protein